MTDYPPRRFQGGQRWQDHRPTWLEDVDLEDITLRGGLTDECKARLAPYEINSEQEAEAACLGKRAEETLSAFEKWDMVLAYRLQMGHGSATKIARWLWCSEEAVRRYTRCAELIPGPMRHQDIPLGVYYDVVKLEQKEEGKGLEALQAIIDGTLTELQRKRIIDTAFGRRTWAVDGSYEINGGGLEDVADLAAYLTAMVEDGEHVRVKVWTDVTGEDEDG